MPRDHNVRLTMQEGKQKKPWYSYKFKQRSRISAEPPVKKPRQAEPSTSTETANESQTMGEENNNMDTSDGATVQDDAVPAIGSSFTTIGGGGGKGSSGIRGTVQMPPGKRIKRNINYQTYTQMYKFRINASLMEYQLESNALPNSSSWAIRFPYHDLPVEHLGFFLQNEEILKILRECTSAKVISCKVQVYAKQAQLPFVTGTTVTALANNNIGYYLNKIHPDFGRVRQGTLNPTPFVVGTCWGSHISQLPTSVSFTTANLGQLGATHVTRNLDQRFIYRGLTNVANTGVDNIFNYLEQIPPIEKYIEKRWNASFNEGLFCEWEYQPEDGLFHQVGRISDKICFFTNELYYQKNRQVQTDYGRNTSNGAQTKFIQNVGSGLTNTSSLSGNETYSVEQMPIEQRTEQISIEWNGRAVIPPLIIGLQPIVSGTIDTTQGDLVNAQLELEVHTEIVIEELRGNSYMMRYGGNLIQPDPAYGKIRSVSSITATGDVSYLKGNVTVHNRNNNITITPQSDTQIASLPEPNILTPVVTSELKSKAKMDKTTEEEKIKEQKEDLEKIQHVQIKEYLTKYTLPKERQEKKKNDKRDTVKRMLFRNE